MATASSIRSYLGMAMASESLGQMVPRLPADTGRSHPPSAHPAPLVQPPALAAARPAFCPAAGLAGGAPAFSVEFT